jgi:hypothetical protein
MGCPVSELGREKRVVKRSPPKKMSGHFAAAANPQDALELRGIGSKIVGSPAASRLGNDIEKGDQP